MHLEERWNLAIRMWGNAAEGETEMLTGTYVLDGEVSRRLLRALPPLIVLRDDEWDCPRDPAPARRDRRRTTPARRPCSTGSSTCSLIAVLRAWFARPEADAPSWYRAYSDPTIGRALRLLHHDPSRQWTVADLARETGMSRAALARRFHQLVGEPPMSFLTDWRIALAADLLLEPGATIGSVAHEVGYGSPFALSTAFKRLRGDQPAAAPRRRRGLRGRRVSVRR